MKHVITPDILKKAYRNYEKGMFLRELESKYGFSGQSLRIQFRKHFKEYKNIAKSRRTKLPREDIKEAFKKYKNGASLCSLAKIYKVHNSSLRYVFLRDYKTVYSKISKERRAKWVTRDFILNIFEEYKKGNSVYFLARKYGISDDILYRWFGKFPDYHKISEQRKANRAIIKSKIKTMFEEYRRRQSLAEISRKYGISQTTLAKHFRKFPDYKKIVEQHRRKVAIKNLRIATKKNIKVTKKVITEMIKLRREGKTVYEIADILGINSMTVIYYLKTHFPNYTPFDEAKYLRYKGAFGEKLIEEFLKLLDVKYTRQKVLSNGKKPDFIVNNNCFLEVKSKFLTFNDFNEILHKYLEAEEMERGMIIAFYGYSRHIKNNDSIMLLDIKNIEQKFKNCNKTQLVGELKDFVNLTFKRWQTIQKEGLQSSLESFME